MVRFAHACIKRLRHLEAAKTVKGRERLEALFLQFESMSSDKANEPFEPDIDFLRGELGI